MIDIKNEKHMNSFRKWDEISKEIMNETNFLNIRHKETKRLIYDLFKTNKRQRREIKALKKEYLKEYRINKNSNELEKLNNLLEEGYNNLNDNNIKIIKIFKPNKLKINEPKVKIIIKKTPNPIKREVPQHPQRTYRRVLDAEKFLR